MGIQGLIPLLKSIQAHTHISAFKDQTLGVDGYVWLHKGGFACAPQLVQGHKTTKYVDYVMHRVRMMRHHGVEPYMVFDGGPLPAKKGTESDRAKNRAENLAKAKAFQARGQHTLARDYFTKCLDVTPEMAYQVIKALKKEAVSYVVAPYEADAQLAYLERNGIIDGVITEDSDLLVFGCNKVLFKMDSDGNCVCIERERFGSNVDLSLVGWSDKEFRRMAILSGCDYLASISGMGIKTAHKLLRKFKTLEKVLQHLRVDSNMRVPKGYYESFIKAELPFLHQRVYCPVLEQLNYLTPLPDNEEWSADKEAYVGNNMDPELAKGIAEGSVDPISLLPMVDINPSYAPHLHGQKQVSRSKPKVEKGTLTNYFNIVSKNRPATLTAISPKQSVHLGSSSGLKTLSEQMDAEREARLVRRSETAEGPTTSKFFAQPPDLSSISSRPTSPSHLTKRKRPEEEHGVSTPRIHRRSRPEKENQPVETVDPVMQEPGYQSPCSIADVSSPIERISITDDVEDQAISPSPLKKGGNIPGPYGDRTPRCSPTQSRILCRDTPSLVSSYGTSLVLVQDTPSPRLALAISRSEPFSVDLKDAFRNDDEDIDSSGHNSSGPDTPEDSQLEELSQIPTMEREVEDLTRSDNDDIDILTDNDAQKVMIGWRSQWSHTTSNPKTYTKLPITLELMDDDDTFLMTPSNSSATPIPTPISVPSAISSKSFRPLGSSRQKHSRPPRKSTGSMNSSSKLPKARARASLDSREESGSSSLTQSLLSFRYSR